MRIRLTWEGALYQRKCDEDRAGENQANLGGGHCTKGTVMRTELVRIRPNLEALDKRNCDEDRTGDNQAKLGGTGTKKL